MNLVIAPQYPLKSISYCEPGISEITSLPFDGASQLQTPQNHIMTTSFVRFSAQPIAIVFVFPSPQYPLCRTEEDAAGMLANMSQSNAVLAAAGGQDPLAGAMQGQDGTKNPEQVCLCTSHIHTLRNAALS